MVRRALVPDGPTDPDSYTYDPGSNALFDGPSTQGVLGASINLGQEDADSDGAGDACDWSSGWSAPPRGSPRPVTAARQPAPLVAILSAASPRRDTERRGLNGPTIAS